MNIADQFQEVGLFLTEKGLVAVLDKMAATLMVTVKILGIAGEQTSHE